MLRQDPLAAHPVRFRHCACRRMEWLKTIQIHVHVHVDDHVCDWQGLVVLDVDLVVDVDVNGFSNQ